MTNNQSNIHKYKYLTLKTAIINEDIKFNKKCLSENITPNYVQLKTKCKSKAALKTLQVAKKIWIREEINSLYEKLEHIKKEKAEMYENIRSQYHQESIEEIEDYINDWITPKIKKKKETHKKKLKNLSLEQQNDPLIDMINNLPNFYPKVQNLTNITFNKEENGLMEKSLKYNINLDNRDYIIRDELINMDVAIRSTDRKIQEPLRHAFVHEINKIKLETKSPHTTKKSTQDMKLIKSIGDKLKENDALICKADKGNTAVIITKEDYENKVNTFLNNNDFQILTKDPTQDFTKKTNNSITNCKTIPKDEQHRLKVINPKAPKLRGQPKVHKPDIPIRPVVNFRSAPTYNICKYLNNTIKDSLLWENNYSIKSTTDLVNQIKDLHIPQNSIFISFDIKDMYSNIPPDETIKILENDLKKNNKLSKQRIKDIIKLTKLCTDQNYFEFNSTFYKQENGLAMGSPLSGLLSDIYVHHLETNKIINESNPHKKNITYWYRYVDDIICLFTGNIEECNDFLTYLNSLSQRIQFTMEVQTYKINYLDLTISKQNNYHQFDIFRKPTQTDLLIPSSSNHPWKYKMSGIRSMVNRLLNIPLDVTKFKKEKNTIKYLAQKNGYKPETIDKMIKNIKKKRSKNLKNPPSNEGKRFIRVPYNTIINKAVRKTFDKSELTLSYATRNNTFKIIEKMSRQEQINNEYQQSGIYRINCSDCSKFYIGQTGRSFQARFNEHIQALKSNNRTTMKSNFAEHLLSTNHNYKNIKENLEIISYRSKGEKMNVEEEFCIYNAYKENPQELLNTHVPLNNPIFKKIRSLKMTRTTTQP